jgi:hypothetical protein
VVEEWARIEGSAGWLSMISTAGSFLAAFLGPPVAQRSFLKRSTAYLREISGRRNAPIGSMVAIG